MELEVAKKAFAKNKSYIYLDFIHSLGPLNTKSAKLSFTGDVLAFKNQFNEAAKLFKQAGLEEKAISMYTDLRMFDWAQDIIKSSHSQAHKQVNIKKADWIESINDPRAAAEMYLAARKIGKVIEIVGQYGYIDM
jgi:intraflagellar transport 122 homolog (WD repeat protein 10).